MIVQTTTAELHDAGRDREIPIRVWAPASDGDGPVVIVSHGMGESRDTYAWLAEVWAARGYMVVGLTHRGSDREVLERAGILAIIRATRDPQTWRDRPQDVSFVLDAIESGDPHIPLLQRADVSRVGVAGHSAGAFTAAALAGLAHSEAGRAKDARVKAIIALSMPKLSSIFEPAVWSGIATPALHMTGSLDASIQYWTFPGHRRIAFDNAPARGDQYLITLRGATHNTYSNPEPRREGREMRLRRTIARAATLFLDAFVGGQADARGGLDALGEERGIRLERK